jgi:hypothetical protein
MRIQLVLTGSNLDEINFKYICIFNEHQCVTVKDIFFNQVCVRWQTIERYWKSVYRYAPKCITLCNIIGDETISSDARYDLHFWCCCPTLSQISLMHSTQTDFFLTHVRQVSNCIYIAGATSRVKNHILNL